MIYSVFGAGRQGIAAAYDLLKSGSEVHLADCSEEALADANKKLKLEKNQIHIIDFVNESDVKSLLEISDGAVFAADYSLNLNLVKWSIESDCHCVDFGGNHIVVKEQHDLNELAKERGVTVVPDTGLTPGLAGILAAGGINELDEAIDAKIRVGGLPQSPEPPFNYALVFSVRGLTNEYLEPSVILEGGEKMEVPSLTGLEELEFDGRRFEAFYTSGGTSTLPDTLQGKVKNLDCKTIRYPGHADFISFVFNLGFGKEKRVQTGDSDFVPRSVFEKMLSDTLPHNPPDEIVMRVTVQGIKDGKEVSVIYEMQDFYDEEIGFTSMQKTTAWPGTIILQMVTNGEIKTKGVIFQELEVDSCRLIEELGKRQIEITKKII